ncbi:MAG: hypothetical protein HPY59_13900 [Anaerolineae bacterium]|jgi:hypothetical protein|nr:hypothetical protein [Anaerolineae bacterium]
MRTILRTVIITIIVGGSILTIFTLLSKSINSLDVVKASNVRSIPDYCVPIELQIIEGELSQYADAKSNPIWLDKKAALEKSMQECALLATTYPPAIKPENEIGVIPPTSEPLPPQKIVTGIQKTILLPSGDFIPTVESENNYWAGLIDGETIQILAGIQRERDDTWREAHPEWAKMGPQGAVMVVDSNWSLIALVQTPTRNGYVHFVKECDSLLLLQADDGTMFVFDPIKFDFASHDSGCSILE